MNILAKSVFLIAGMLILALPGCEKGKDPGKLESATMIPDGKKLNDFNLTQFGQGEFTLDSIRGDWSLFFFGYTRCPDVCPTELFTLAGMMSKIEQKPDALKMVPQVVFVSVDPQQDQPEQLQNYASYYHPSFKGVTGNQQEIDKLTSEIGIFYERVYHLNGQILEIAKDGEIPEGLEYSYLINHSATIVVTNPDGDLHAIFSAPHDPEVMIRDLAAIQRVW